MVREEWGIVKKGKEVRRKSGRGKGGRVGGEEGEY